MFPVEEPSYNTFVWPHPNRVILFLFLLWLGDRSICLVVPKMWENNEVPKLMISTWKLQMQFVFTLKLVFLVMNITFSPSSGRTGKRFLTA